MLASDNEWRIRLQEESAAAGGRDQNPPLLGWASPPTAPAVVGPAKLLLVGYGGGLATFRLSPNFADPQKTAIVLPGPDNTAVVTMQSSTNLVDWFPTTNGIYGGNVARFFRIDLQKVPQ